MKISTKRLIKEKLNSLSLIFLSDSQQSPVGLLKINKCRIRENTWDIEGGTINISKHLLPHCRNCIDIGANIGLYSLLFSNLCTGRVFCFEPDNRNYAILKENTCKRPNIKLSRLVVSDYCGQIPFGENFVDPRGSRISEAENSYSHNKLKKCITLDTIFKNIKVDLVKIDTDGFEKEILYGARKLLERDRPILLFEVVPENVYGIDKNKIRQIHELLNKNKYHAYAVDEKSSRLMKINLRDINKHLVENNLSFCNVIALQDSHIPLIPDDCYEKGS